MSDGSKSLLFSTDTVKDIVLWRRKKLSLLVLLVATVTWVLLDVYEFNFITVASWLAMLIVTSLFLYGNLVRLFRKEEPKISNWKISEETTTETAKSVRGMIEEGIRWMFHVSAESEWFIFARVVTVLWLLSYVGSFFDFLTLLYVGTVMGMSVPVIYVKNEEKIKRCEEWMKMKARRFYEMMDEKVFKQVKNKVVKVEEKKDKKVE
ncbi:reticulon-like protein B13 [Ricinus communis]|uniref:Reticulon-like protein n=1 Tax=Ricinus communis TaxID=3988 RepID=B9S8L7_RICCO|nr:reticulon-like protein B13 [Ricinus communis]EEF40020.1 conserved hypothetical protein [Ricinus communis]|eukprot:XP_002522336.1 reticulon-like protein B13 [Ricinus communis]